MCIVFSLPKQFQRVIGDIHVSSVIETLIYDSVSRNVIISVDCIVRNDSDQNVDLWMTHSDNVEGRLGTEDWSSLVSDVPDERAWLVQSLHDGCWDFDIETAILRYRDPAKVYPDTCSIESCSIVAKGLSFDPNTSDSPFGQTYSDFIDRETAAYCPPGRSGTTAIYRFLPFPECSRSETPNERVLPYTTFRIGPIRPALEGVATAFRLTLVISNETYKRLVQPYENSPFYIYSAARACEHIENFALPRFQRDRRMTDFSSFFHTEITPMVISPEHYQIIVGQPAANESNRRCVLARPTSTRISERIIGSSELRRRAMWFNTWSADFSMELEYGETTSVQSEGFRLRHRKAVS